MLRDLVLPLFLLVLSLAPAQAERPAGLDDLVSDLAIPDLVAIMREEGLAYGDELEAEMFPGRGGDRWDAVVAEIYDGGRMQETLTATLARGLGREEIAPLRAFFSSETGARIVALEVAARRALLDPEVEEASLQRLEEMQADDVPRLALIERFVAVNNLVEANVAGALNSNYAFYSGLVDGRAFDFELTEEQMLRDVWAQEPEIREETREWLLSYLAMAYDPLPDTALEDYIALSETEAGRALNAALFAAFDATFTRISRQLGLAAARFIAGQDI